MAHIIAIILRWVAFLASFLVCDALLYAIVLGNRGASVMHVCWLAVAAVPSALRCCRIATRVRGGVSDAPSDATCQRVLQVSGVSYAVVIRMLQLLNRVDGILPDH
jgi:hypothetical protein